MNKSRFYLAGSREVGNCTVVPILEAVLRAAWPKDRLHRLSWATVFAEVRVVAAVVLTEDDGHAVLVGAAKDADQDEKDILAFLALHL